MERLSEIDLGSVILSLAVITGFLAFGVLIIRLIVGAIKEIFSN